MIADVAFVLSHDVENAYIAVATLIRNKYSGNADEVVDIFDDTNRNSFTLARPKKLLFYACRTYN